MVFDKQWFAKHNNTLCWFANAPVIKYWFRWLLRIHNDISWNTKINRIEPNSFTYNGKIVGDKIELTTDFRTHEKFGKRLYYGLKPLWYLLHFWDWSTSIQPALNCGFDTLTVYPDAGTGNTTVDGSVVREGVGAQTWSQLTTGAGTAAYADVTNIGLEYQSSSGSWSSCYRYIATIDTSSLDDDSTISNVVFSLYGYGKDDTGSNNPNIDIYLSTPTANNNLQASDYGQIGTTSQTGSPITYSNWSTTGYNDFTFNSTGKGNISKTGISKLGARNANYDVSGSAPSTVGDMRLEFYQADQTGTTNDPKLVVTYTTVVGPANVKTYKGLAAASVKTCKGLAIASVKSKKGLA